MGFVVSEVKGPELADTRRRSRRVVSDSLACGSVLLSAHALAFRLSARERACVSLRVRVRARVLVCYESVKRKASLI